MAGDEDVVAAKAELREFLTDVENLLEGSLTDYPELFGASAPQLVQAWADVKTRSDYVRKALDGTRPDGKTLSETQTKKLHDRLQQHGLTEQQLAFKIALFRSAAADFLEEASLQADAEAFWRTWIVRLRGSSLLERVLRSGVVRRLERLVPAGRNVLRGKLKRALAAANVVLDSLAQALAFIPAVGMAAGALGEFKSAADVALGEPDKHEKPKRRASPTPNDNSPHGRLRNRLGLW